MGVIQNTVNQGLGTLAGASTVVGIGKAVGEEVAEKAYERTNLRVKDYMEKHPGEMDFSILNDADKYTSAYEKAGFTPSEAMDIWEGNEQLVLAQSQNPRKAMKAIQKAKLSVAGLNKLGAQIKAGYRAVIDRITEPKGAK